jgi:hypothetical protein
MFDQLPWQTKPHALENSYAEIQWKGGVLKLPRLGYMTVSELAEIAKVDPKNAAYRLTLQYSNTLAKATERSPRDCWALLAQVVGQELGHPAQFNEQDETLMIVHQELIAKYLEEFKTVNTRVMIRSVNIILQRIAPSWTEEKTSQLPGPLLDQIYAFQQEEERGLDAPADPEADAQQKMRELEEELGKLREVSQLSAIDPTGEAPTGNANGSGPAPPSSPESASGSSQAATSSKRSKRVAQPNESASIKRN